MPGRGPEDIFIDTKIFSWPLNFSSDNFNKPPPHSTAVIFHGPTLHVRFHKSGLELLLRKNVFASEITDVVEGHLTKMKICLAKREKPAKKRIVFIDLTVIFEEKFFHQSKSALHNVQIYALQIEKKIAN